MEEEILLPEEMILLILSFVPVKSLIRFTCVSKRFRSIILWDPKFAKSQSLNRSQSQSQSHSHRRLLLAASKRHELDSIDIDSSQSPFEVGGVRKKLTSTFDEDYHGSWIASMLGSLNGIAFLTLSSGIIVWNPTTGFFKRLPDLPCFPSSSPSYRLVGFGVFAHYGVGYLPATDDYIVFISGNDLTIHGFGVVLFSTRANAWKQLSKLSMVALKGMWASKLGIFFSEALHWTNDNGQILAFDLNQQNDEEELREMSPPSYGNEEEDIFYVSHLGVFSSSSSSPSSAGGGSAGSLLSLTRLPRCPSSIGIEDCMDVWVLKEYHVPDSWTKIFKFKFIHPEPEENFWLYRRVLLTETGMVVQSRHARKYNPNPSWLIKIDYKQQQQRKHDIRTYKVDNYCLSMIQYQETLMWI